MSSFTGSPYIVKGGIVILNPSTAAIDRIISLQYNPDSLTRTLQVQGLGGDDNAGGELFRVKGTPVETLKVDVELDATDQLEKADPGAVNSGIQAQLAALETILYPRSSQLLGNNKLSNAGTLEIIPMEMPLTLFIWNKNRILPVRITEFSITEEAFDVNLNPIRAKISLGMKVLSVDNLGFDNRGSGIFMNYLQSKERLAQMSAGGSLQSLGINSIS
jgi:hypothetical protein